MTKTNGKSSSSAGSLTDRPLSHFRTHRLGCTVRPLRPRTHPEMSPTAAYTGLTTATDNDGVTRLYAANFRAGKIDVFDRSYKPVRSRDAFSDPHLPAGYAPFNIKAVTVAGITRIFVMYAMQDPDNIFGQGRGIVNTFHPDGSGCRRFAQHGELNAPWGLVIAPGGSGDLAGTVWIGNFGDGRINAYDSATGEFVKEVGGPQQPLQGLWSRMLRNSAIDALSAA